MIILYAMETLHGMVGHNHNNETQLIFCDKKSCFRYSNSDFVLFIPKAHYDFHCIYYYVDLPSASE